MREFGRVDIVVNNAGAARGEDRVAVVDVDLDVWRHVIDVNLHGSFYMSRSFGRRLIEQGDGGSITNISSIAGKLLPGNAAAYAASKAGLQALTAAMSREVAPHGIRVNALCVGIIDTSRMDDMPRGDVVGRPDPPQRAARPGRHRRRHRQHGDLPGQRAPGPGSPGSPTTSTAARWWRTEPWAKFLRRNLEGSARRADAGIASRGDHGRGLSTDDVQLKARLDHPIVDADAHQLEVVPGAVRVPPRGRRARDAREVDRAREPRPAHVPHDARASASTTGRRCRCGGRCRPRTPSTAAPPTLPRLLYERLDEIGLDFTIVYPGTRPPGHHAARHARRRTAPRVGPRVQPLQRGDVRRPRRPHDPGVGVIPMHTPEEAIEELEFATGARAQGVRVRRRRAAPGARLRARAPRARAPRLLPGLLRHRQPVRLRPGVGEVHRARRRADVPLRARSAGVRTRRSRATSTTRSAGSRRAARRSPRRCSSAASRSGSRRCASVSSKAG